MKICVFIGLIFICGNTIADPFFKDHQLILFYASTCQYCQQFAPIIDKWSQINSAKLVALSLDNKPLDSLRNFQPATTQLINTAYAGRPITYPALFIANQTRGLLYPVAFGALGYAELSDRLNQIQSKIENYEARKPA